MKKLLAELNKFKAKNHPILDNVLLQDGYLTMFDLEHSISVKTEFKERGLVPFDLLKKVGSKFDNVNISFAGKQAVLSSGDKKFTTTCDNIDDYPFIPKVQGDMLFSFEMNKDVRTLEKFVSKDEMRPAMMGVHFGKTHLAATNGHMLKWIEYAGSEHEFIMPKQLFKMVDGVYNVYKTDGKAIAFVSEDITYTFRAIDATYPDYPQVIPAERPIAFKIDKKELIECIDAALISANSVTNLIVIDMIQQKMTSEDIDMGTEFSCPLKLEMLRGEGFRIGFNGALLNTCLSGIADSEITMEYVQGNKPVIMNGNTLLMPLML